MGRLHLSLGLLLSLALCGACQKDSGPSDYGDVGSDARRPSDSGISCMAEVKHHLSCNPVTQAGCEFGYKCAVLLESAEPFLSRTACVPEGDALPGESCTRGPAGVCAGFDDCIAGFHCTENTCARICDVGPPEGCREDFEPFGTGSYCTEFEGVFSDSIGVCVNACNPANDQESDAGTIANSDCELGELCVYDPTREAAVCLPPEATGF